MTTRLELVDVPAHQTERLTVTDPTGTWTFWRVRTGCIRVQRGDFTAYITPEDALVLATFIEETR